MSAVLESALHILFSGARSQNGWLQEPVTDEELSVAYDVAKWGPTSMNSQPMRLVFLRSSGAKERLRPALSPGNVDKALNAPVVALIAYDTQFHHHLPKIFPHNPNAQAFFSGNEALIETTGFRNGTLQAAYFLLALRSVGLDVGPMSGFDTVKVNAEFFEGTALRINFICGIGHGDAAKVFSRSPRLDFKEIASFL